VARAHADDYRAAAGALALGLAIASLATLGPPAPQPTIGQWALGGPACGAQPLGAVASFSMPPLPWVDNDGVAAPVAVNLLVRLNGGEWVAADSLGIGLGLKINDDRIWIVRDFSTSPLPDTMDVTIQISY